MPYSVAKHHSVQVPYRVVEVNPLTKKQLKWTTHKKVPVVLIDNELVDDSSLILSRLAVELEPKLPEPKRGWFSKPAKVCLTRCLCRFYKLLQSPHTPICANSRQDC